MSTLRCTASSLFAAVLLVFHDPALAQTTNWSVAVLPEVLATVTSGQMTAQIGDMEILAINLKSWKNQPAGGPPL